MIRRLLHCIFILIFIPNITFGENFSTERIIDSLKNKQSIDFTLIPTINVYKDLCKKKHINSVTNQISDICNVVLESSICKSIPKENRLNCNKINDKSQIDIWDFLKGCTKGVFDSVKNFLNFIWAIMKWVWSNSIDSEKRSQTIEQASEYMGIIKLYLHTEFEKAYEETASPFRTVKALKAMGGSISNLILNSITDLISQKYQELGCLNFESKSQMICQFVGDIFIPPAAAISLIKYGPKAIKMFPNIKEAFSKLNNIPDIKKVRLKANSRRIIEAENILNRSLGQKQKNAILKAHEIGMGAKGKDGGPARIGNYTTSQIRQKAKELRNAGFSQSEVRKLIENGIVGLDQTENQGLKKYINKLFRSKTAETEAGLPKAARRDKVIDESPTPILGQEVSFPRSAGGHSVGKITDLDGAKVRIDFTDSDGYRKYKWVHNSQLDILDSGNPLSSTNNIVPGEGRSVAIPRSNGGLSNAQITENLGDKVRVNFKDKDGFIKEKVVPVDYLYDPIDLPQGHIQLGDEVSIPRSSGGRSDGEITAIIGDEVKVDFIDIDGQKKYKILPAKALSQATHKNNTSSSLPSVIAHKGLTPTESVQLNGYGNIKVGDFFQDSGGRVFTVAEVEVNGRIRNQLFYRSNSQAVFRLMPARNQGLAFPGYDKGKDENMLTASPELQEFLSQKLKNNQHKMETIEPEALEGVIPVNRSIDDYLAYLRSDDYVDDRFVQVDKILNEVQRPVSDYVGRNFARPEEIKINNPKLTPDYNRPSKTYEINSPVYGDVKAYVYRSHDGTLEYTLLRDSNNRVWFGDIGYSSSPITPHGLRSYAVNAEELTTPLWEYHSQIPQGFANGETNALSTNYGNSWDYIKKIPEIQRWYRENGIEVPK